MDRLPPPPIPARPDLVAPAALEELPPKRRFPVWVVVVAVILGLSFGAAALAPLLEGSDEPTGPGYQFLDRTDEGAPTRWNPCQPIHYVVNTTLAPEGSLGDVHEAVRRISAATGIAFVYEGPLLVRKLVSDLRARLTDRGVDALPRPQRPAPAGEPRSRSG